MKKTNNLFATKKGFAFIFSAIMVVNLVFFMNKEGSSSLSLGSIKAMAQTNAEPESGYPSYIEMRADPETEYFQWNDWDDPNNPFQEVCYYDQEYWVCDEFGTPNGYDCGFFGYHSMEPSCSMY
jgi:hypothetical protein